MRTKMTQIEAFAEAILGKKVRPASHPYAVEYIYFDGKLLMIKWTDEKAQVFDKHTLAEQLTPGGLGWCDEDWEIVEETTEQKGAGMKKSELKAGMVVEDLAGRQYMVIRETDKGDILVGPELWTSLKSYTEDLSSAQGYGDMEIVLVRSPASGKQYIASNWSSCPIIWTRPKPSKQIDIGGKLWSEDTIKEALKNHCPE